MKWAFAIIALAAAINALNAHGAFPTVGDLEQALHLTPGGQLPKDVMAADGTIYHSYYVKGHELGNGYYNVTLKLGK